MNTSSDIRCHILGCGPGTAEYILPVTHRIVQESEVLAGASRLLDLFPDFAGERICVTADLDQAIAAIRRAVERNRKVAVLVSGDPGFHSFSQRVLQHVGRANCRCIPGISSAQLAFARIGHSWDDAAFFSAHAALPELPPEQFSLLKKWLILAGNPRHYAWLDKVCQATGRTHTLYLCENLALPDEAIWPLPPGAIFSAMAPSSLAILIGIHHSQQEG